MYDETLEIIEFADVDEAIDFANETWSDFNDDIDHVGSMRDVTVELKEDKRWLLLIGICDICNYKSVHFIPACAFENGISGIECFECGNKSVYPSEVEDPSESEKNY